jgi:hypothetical protein
MGDLINFPSKQALFHNFQIAQQMEAIPKI